MCASQGDVLLPLSTLKHCKIKIVSRETHILTKYNRNGATNDNSPHRKTEGY